MKILGIDYGRSKVGLALGDTSSKLSDPLKVLPILNFKFEILSLIKENGVEKIVIGITGGKIDEEIKRFGEGMENYTGLPVEYVDETLSTQDAQKLMIENKKKKKYRKGREDAIAAAIMLQYYLEG